MTDTQTVHLVQYLAQGQPQVALVVDELRVRPLRLRTTYALALQAVDAGTSLAAAALAAVGDELVDYQQLVDERRLLPPLTHPDPAHCCVSGTGLTHLASAAARQRMHELAETDLTDSMRMYRMGVEGGKPPAGGIGVQPEWFYKGDGGCVRAPESALTMPGFAMDGGEEAELAGVYLIAADGAPRRLGFALGNEFSDHAMERVNYLWLAQSKLRTCAFGPELRVASLPDEVLGTSRILRDGQVAWQGPFASGEAHMSHGIANLEQHHFKHAGFRRPGDIHIHFLGAAALSSADGFATRVGDRFEIACPLFGRPLRSLLACEPAPMPAFAVSPL